MALSALTIDYADRKEVWYMLDQLQNPRQRVAFLRWACTQVRGAGTGQEVVVTQADGTTDDTYRGIMLLAHSHGLNLDRAAAELAQWLRKR